MSMFKEHCQVIADKIALQEYGREFHQLPYDYQSVLFSKAQEIAQEELKATVNRDK